MTVDGKQYPPVTVEIEADKVAEFAWAIGADPHDGVPPTYAAVYCLGATAPQLLVPEELRRGGAEAVHGGVGRRHAVVGIGADGPRELGDLVGLDLHGDGWVLLAIDRHENVRKRNSRPPPASPMRGRQHGYDRPGRTLERTRRTIIGRSEAHASITEGLVDWAISGGAYAATTNASVSEWRCGAASGKARPRRFSSSDGVSPDCSSAPAMRASTRTRRHTPITVRGRR